MAIEPDAHQMAAVAAAAGAEDDGPVVMLNLNRYRERAEYEGDPPGGGSTEVSGHEAYLRYGEVAQRVLGRVGGRILWHTTSGATVVGEPGDRFDEVIAVWYPSTAAFAALATHEEILPVLEHRRAGLEAAVLLSCEPGTLPGDQP